MCERSGDWIQQAYRVLESPKAQANDRFYEWAGFIARQAAEKACKAVCQKHRAEACGHPLLHLLSGLREKVGIPAGSQKLCPGHAVGLLHGGRRPRCHQ